MDIFLIIISEKAEENLKKIPKYRVTKLMSWVELVSHEGLNQARKIPGYHDEPLQGKRSGQRFIRMNRSYRAIYEINEQGKVHFVEILEVYSYHKSYTKIHAPNEAIMRTNIVIDDQLMKSAMGFGEFSTKKALVEASLRLYLQLQQQNLIRQYKGKLAWEGNLDLMRQSSQKSGD